MFALLDSLFLYRDGGIISKIQKAVGGLSIALSVAAEERSASRRKEKENRRKKLRRNIDKYKKASHENSRTTFCALNERGEKDQKGSKLNVGIFHGLRGYAGLYKAYAEHHNAKNRNAVILDFPGHGKNPGEPCRIHHPKYFEECVGTAIVECDRLNGNVPMVIITFSMGGLITLQYLFDSAPRHIRHRIAGVVCLGVPLSVGEKVPLGKALLSAISCGLAFLKSLFWKSDDTGKKDVPPWKLFLAPVLAWCFPWWKIKELCMDKDNINHDPEVVEEIWSDPMIYKGPLRAWTGYSILKMANNVCSLLRDVDLGIPLYFARGELDTTAEEGPYVMSGIPIKNYPGFKHELLKGVGSEQVIKDIDAWIENVVLPSWALTKQKREINRAFFRKLAKQEKEMMNV